MSNSVEIEINGVKHQVNADPDTSLLEIIRDDLGMTGTKFGCGESECGACTVLINGTPSHACITQLSEIAGASITTIEGLEKNGKLHPLQQAFIDEGAMQCGYCVSGMIMTGVGLLEKNPNPTDAQIVQFMSGNLCRCGGYPRMLSAIKRASQSMRGSK